MKELQRERDGNDLLTNTTKNSVDQQHRTTFRELKHFRRSDKKAILMGRDIEVVAISEDFGTRTAFLRSEMAGSFLCTRNKGSGCTLGAGVERVE